MQNQLPLNMVFGDAEDCCLVTRKLFITTVTIQVKTGSVTVINVLKQMETNSFHPEMKLKMCLLLSHVSQQSVRTADVCVSCVQSPEARSDDGPRSDFIPVISWDCFMITEIIPIGGEARADFLPVWSSLTPINNELCVSLSGGWGVNQASLVN